MIKALIFDCFGVFYADPVYAYMNDPATPKQKADTLHSLDVLAAEGKLSKAGFVEQAATITGQTAEQTEKQFFHSNEHNTQLINLVKSLRLNYKTALLSNIGGDMMDSFFSPEDYNELFDEVILSGDVKMAKPDPEIFKLACSRLDVDLSEAVMADDMQDNIDAVKTLGMQGIRYTDFESFSESLKDILAQ